MADNINVSERNTLPVLYNINVSTVILPPRQHYWGEPERAPHLREVRHRCLYVYIYVPYVVLGHGTNLCRVQNGQDGRPLRSRCVRLKYSLRTASNEKEVVRNEAYAPTSQPGKNTGIVRRNSAN